MDTFICSDEPDFPIFSVVACLSLQPRGLLGTASGMSWLILQLLNFFLFSFFFSLQVLVAPITEKGQTWRDIYLPGEGHLWMDTNTAHVFDGGTILRNYSASLAEVPVFVKTS